MKTELQDLLAECNAELENIDNMLEKMEPLDKAKQYLTKYALIKACGTLEYVYKSIVADFFDCSEISQIHTYIEETVRKGSRSATYEKMCDLLGMFDENWKTQFKVTIKQHDDGQRMIDSAKSLVANRHLFAHGKNPTATFKDIQQYYKYASQLITIMDGIVR